MLNFILCSLDFAVPEITWASRNLCSSVSYQNTCHKLLLCDLERFIKIPKGEKMGRIGIISCSVPASWRAPHTLFLLSRFLQISTLKDVKDGPTHQAIPVHRSWEFFFKARAVRGMRIHNIHRKHWKRYDIEYGSESIKRKSKKPKRKKEKKEKEEKWWQKGTSQKRTNIDLKAQLNEFKIQANTSPKYNKHQ